MEGRTKIAIQSSRRARKQVLHILATPAERTEAGPHIRIGGLEWALRMAMERLSELETCAERLIAERDELISERENK